MLVSFRNRLAQFRSVLLSLAAFQAFAAPAGEPVYFWKPNDVLRFEYSKIVRTMEELNLDEVYSEQPVTIVSTDAPKSVQLVVYQSRTFEEVTKTWRLGAPKTLAVCAPGDTITLTGQFDEDEHHFRWVEARTADGVTGYLPGNTKVYASRDFGFDAIVILEIKNKTDKGTFGVLHFDAPHVVMPDGYLQMPNYDDPVEDKEKTKQVIKALEGAIKLARWNVILDGTGVMHIDSRAPKGLDDWLKDTEHIAFWRAKFRKLWMDLVEKHLGLVSSGDDRNLFVALTAPPEATASAGATLDKIRPYRSAAESLSNWGGKAEFHFERVAPPQAGKPLAIPHIGPPDDPKTPAIVMLIKPGIHGPVTDSNLNGEDKQVGTAVFDTKLGIVDTLTEGYSFDAEYSCDEDARRHYKITQKVSVQYSLKRLAPPISGRSEGVFDGPVTPGK